MTGITTVGMNPDLHGNSAGSGTSKARTGRVFLRRALLFITLLLCITVALELSLARANHKTHGQFRVGEDVYQVLEAAELPHPQVTTLYLGDSVARQLFKMHTEPSPKLLYLPSNQAISLAGQYCILENVIERTPNLRHVCLLYTPRSWANNLDQIFTHDYFCGYFHSPALVWEIWTLQRDMQLTEAHVGRMLLPNIMAENSYLNRSQSNYGVPIVPVTSEPEKHPLSKPSKYFVNRIKDLCRERQITLRILPCPCMGTAEQFAELAPIYDAPITFYDPDLFLPDRIHFRKPNVEPMRQRVVEQFHLRDEQ